MKQIKVYDYHGRSEMITIGTELQRMFKVGEIVRMMPDHQTPRDKKGGAFARYKVAKINRVTLIAHNLGTCVPHTLRIENLYKDFYQK